MNIGSLYTVKKFYWLLFPTKETASEVVAAGALLRFDDALDAEVTLNIAAYWSSRCNFEVTYFSPNEYIVFLEEDELFKKVLTSDGRIGWIWFGEGYNESFEEVKTEQ